MTDPLRLCPTRGAHQAAGRGAILLLAQILMVATTTATSAGASTFRTILVDDRVDDWGATPAFHSDPAGDNGTAPVDLGRLYIANDDRFVYLRFEIGQLLNLQALPAALRIYLDTDASSATGYMVQGIGSDLMVECSNGSGIAFYEQTSGNFRASNIGHAALGAYQGPTVAALEFELRLKRSTPLPIHGQPAFPGPTFRIALEALNTSGQPVEIEPNTPGTLTYTLAAGTPDPPPNNGIARLDPSHIRILSYNVHLDDLMGPDSTRFRRILRAIQPDVIGFQELYNTTAAAVASRLDRDLPLAGGALWQAFKNSVRSQVTASRFPLTLDPGAPSQQLATRVDLPDADYGLDLYLINSHLKCCGSIGTSEDQQRQANADAIAAWIHDLETPGGAALPQGTPIVHLGDMNLVGGPRPLQTLITGDIVNEGTYGPDHPLDWDGTDLARGMPIHSDGFAVYTWREDGNTFVPGKLDYIFYTDATATAGNQFILNTLDMSPAKLASLGLLVDDTNMASDHLPSVLDLLPTSASAGVPGGPEVSGGLAAYPNPFIQNTQVGFELAAYSEVGVAIYDVSGHRVRELVRGARPAGRYWIPWDGRDDRGHTVSSGVYMVRLTLSRGGTVWSERSFKLVRMR